MCSVRAVDAECGGGEGGAGAGAAHQAERAGCVLQRQAGHQTHHRQEEAEQVGYTICRNRQSFRIPCALKKYLISKKYLIACKLLGEKIP